VETEVFVNTDSVTLVDPPEESVTLVVLKVAPGPPETLGVRATVPVNPLRLVSVIEEVPDAPAGNVMELGVADIPKSGPRATVTLILTE
jgi:hypothetical protein